jgi:ribosome-associated toxin RatA of RatAB toxin-antitoxin module
MPKVKIQKTISVQAEKLFEAVQDVLKNDKEIKALEPKLEVHGEKVTSDLITAQVSGSRVEGDFKITPDGESSTIDIELRLPITLTPFKGLVQKKIEEKLSKIS